MPRYGGSADKCIKCEKTVYLSEKLTYDKKIFHDDCFRCLTCNTKVTLNKVAMLAGNLYCKPCFKKTFAESGGKYSAFGVGLAKNQNTPAPVAASTPAEPKAEKKVVEQEKNPDQASTRAMFEQKASSNDDKADKPVSSGTKKNFSRFGGGAPKCVKCNKSVYLNEKVEYDKQVFHKSCFKCQTCKSFVSLNKVAMLSGNLYCKPCFKKDFATSGGKYDGLSGTKGMSKHDQAKVNKSKARRMSNSEAVKEQLAAADAAAETPVDAAEEPKKNDEEGEPAKEEPAKEEPAQEEPAKEEPAQEEPAAEEIDPVAAKLAAAAEKEAAAKAKAEADAAATAKFKAEQKAAEEAEQAEQEAKAAAAKAKAKAEAEAKAAAEAEAAKPTAVYNGPELSMDEAWDALCNENSPTNWMCLGFPNAGKKMAHLASGEDGINGLTKWFNESEVFFAAIKVWGMDEQENVTSKRAKYVSLTFVGQKLSGIKRMKVMQNRPRVSALFKGCATQMQFSRLEEVTAEAIARELLACGGAHKPTSYDFGGGLSIPLSDLSQE